MNVKEIIDSLDSLPDEAELRGVVIKRLDGDDRTLEMFFESGSVTHRVRFGQFTQRQRERFNKEPEVKSNGPFSGLMGLLK